ncbi:hypothetical protein ACJZ2D_015081 [Fusarium nematophilum]
MSFQKLVRFEDQGTAHYGNLLESGDHGHKIEKLLGNPWQGLASTGSTITAPKLLSPIESTPIVICVGLNYKQHATEANLKVPTYPVIFTKPSDALAGPSDDVHVHPDAQPQLDYEGELCIVIGRDAKNVSKEDALEYVLGYTIGNDVSARNFQLPEASGGQFCYAKSFDGFAPVGPAIWAPTLIPDPQKLRLRTRVNGEVVQQTETSDMIWSARQIIAHLSRGTTLRRGTIIMTGTPAGVGIFRGCFLKDGDVVEVEVEGLGAASYTNCWEHNPSFTSSRIASASEFGTKQSRYNIHRQRKTIMTPAAPNHTSHPPAAIWKHPHPRATRLDAFRRDINRTYKVDLKTYEQLHRWSVDNLEAFCKEIWVFCGMVSSVSPERVANDICTMWPRPEWFPGARLNYSENILSAGLMAHPDRIAISACREPGTHWRHLTWAQLRRQVALFASALHEAGVVAGDRIAVEAVVLLLAAGSIGAIFSSTAPDMGAEGIVSRYSQIRPKMLFVDTEVLYAGRRRILRKKIVAAVTKLRERVPELAKVVVVTGAPWPDDSCISLAQFLRVRIQLLRFTQLPFDHPIYILYSSGTTGTPKCICHSGGGALLQQKKEFVLSSNMSADSVYYQYTTAGWMMWNYLIGSLSVGARIVLYDGSPLHPSPASQIRLLEEQGVTHWGTSPKLLAALKQSGWKRTTRLESLQVVISSGSSLSPELFRWFYNTFPSEVGLFSGSGGTDLVGGIISGNCLSPVYEGELSSPQLGMRVEVWDSSGQNVDSTGQEGDLVISTPFFSMPTSFYGDNSHEKYRKAYFNKFPGVWCHGDFVKRNPQTGGYVILGRSDGVLNPGGIRFGTAEIYGIVDQFSDVQDCIAVGQRRPDESDEQVLLFIKMKGINFNRTRENIRAAIMEQLSPRHVPAYILEVKDIPFTLNGKKMEMMVKNIVCKANIGNLSSVANPECLSEYEKFADLPLATSTPRL